MNQIIKSDIATDTLLEEVRAAARSGLRVLDAMELGWVGGGDGSPTYDGTPPPP